MDQIGKILGVGDLRLRWRFTRQNIYRRMRLDKEFPKPFLVINGNIFVFKIEDYELLRSGVVGFCGGYCQTAKEWADMSLKDQKKHR